MQINDADQTFTFQFRRVYYGLLASVAELERMASGWCTKRENTFFWGCIHGRMMQIYQESFC
jgi:hypothetical protein